jgi:hypothetical protein
MLPPTISYSAVVSMDANSFADEVTPLKQPNRKVSPLRART